MEGIVSNHELQLTLLKLGAPSVLGAPSASLSMPSKASVIATRVSTGGAIFCLCNKLNLDQSQESHCHRHEAGVHQGVRTGLTVHTGAATGIWHKKGGKLELDVLSPAQPSPAQPEPHQGQERVCALT